ncbi:MAG: hemerythrin family protein [Burkholderiales bacterium]|nr:hemerythrin family protein [Burkholderiales bacterium]MDE1928032.1 hemerythrin family protein [Burkholderiales bacterium]MDE2159396.1 hemerythrin family protein [Burkholderiales bacterium]MDE2502298.1 hemerythrin family protein [Burkholderiales bacterium]
METFPWKPEYEIGDASVDGQHRQLFALANRALAATGRAPLAQAMLQLFEFVREHFSDEERLMRRLDYPGRAEHEAQHDALMERLHGLSLDVAAGTLSRAQMQRFLTHWLLGHMGTQDRRLAAYVHARPRAHA